jgi:hypothetical protein
MVVGETNVPSGHENGTEHASWVVWVVSRAVSLVQRAGAVLLYMPEESMMKLAAWGSKTPPSALKPPRAFLTPVYLGAHIQSTSTV